MSTDSCDSNDEILETMKTVMNKMDELTDEVKHLNYRVTTLEEFQRTQSNSVPIQALSQMKISTDDISHQLEQAHRSMTTAVFFNNPLNMMFCGIKASTRSSLDDIFRAFMVDKLHVDGERAYSMPLHVQYLPSMNSEEVPTPPLCVTLRTTKDRELLSHKCDVHSDVLQSVGISVKASYYTQAGVKYWKVR